MEAFVGDAAPDAYEKLIDRLLASPAFGERWARHWLDVARFAESHGFEHDYDRPNAYPYRDFVIEALNRDLPFDDFVRWQVAGDELAPEEPLAWFATGFLGAGVHATQITANQVEKERYDELDDMLATTGTAMLGLTFGCARCHDHKFDPIPQRDYYRMLSTFTTTVRSDYELDLDMQFFLRLADLGPQPPAQPGPFAAQWGHVGAVLEALVLEPLPQERGVRLAALVDVPIGTDPNDVIGETRAQFVPVVAAQRLEIPRHRLRLGTHEIARSSRARSRSGSRSGGWRRRPEHSLVHRPRGRRPPGG